MDILLDDCYLRDEVLPPRDEPLLLPPLPPLYERLLDDEPRNELPDTVVLWCADDAVPYELVLLLDDDDELRYELDELLFVEVDTLLLERLDDEPPRCVEVVPPRFPLVLLPDDTVEEPRLVVPP